ncbi:MAG: vacuolar family H+-ATPase subunit H [Lachnospiraceae bacterium]|nr:vacuolar family H+-ATPase subunit H [Lachnospiraceae bacterium]MBR5944321.1 vacuolar family H+-ATPase subunit H [Lachnospiraceae bacterium]
MALPTSNIENAIKDIEDYIGGCKYQTFSSTKIVVDKEEIEDLISELRKKTPEEIKRYQRIISNKDAILEDARSKAEALINEATVHTNELINEHEIMKQAYDQANKVVSMASAQAQQILDNATNEANSLRFAAMQYMDDMLAHIEEVLTGSAQAATSNFESLVTSLNEYRDVVISNRNELRPSPEPEPEPTIEPDPDLTITGPIDVPEKKRDGISLI